MPTRTAAVNAFSLRAQRITSAKFACNHVQIDDVLHTEKWQWLLNAGTRQAAQQKGAISTAGMSSMHVKSLINQSLFIPV